MFSFARGVNIHTFELQVFPEHSTNSVGTVSVDIMHKSFRWLQKLLLLKTKNKPKSAIRWEACMQDSFESWTDQITTVDSVDLSCGGVLP